MRRASCFSLLLSFLELPRLKINTQKGYTWLGAPASFQIRHTDVWWVLPNIKEERDKTQGKSLHNKDYLPLSLSVSYFLPQKH